jgi:hypothetical protein
MCGVLLEKIHVRHLNPDAVNKNMPAQTVLNMAAVLVRIWLVKIQLSKVCMGPS